MQQSVVSGAGAGPLTRRSGAPIGGCLAAGVGGGTAAAPRRRFATASAAAPGDGKQQQQAPSSSSSSSSSSPAAAAAAPVPYAQFFGASSTAALKEKKRQAAAAPPPSAAAVAAVAARAAQAAVVAAAAARRGPGAVPVALPDWAARPGAEKLRARTRSGAMVYAAAVQDKEEEEEEDEQGGKSGGGGKSGDWRVSVCVSAADAVKGGAPPGRAPHLHWGLYRAPGAAWRLPPDAALPPGTQRDPATGAARTPMAADARRPGVWTAELRVPRRYAPVQLGFALWHPGADAAADEAAAGKGKGAAAAAAAASAPAAPASAATETKKNTKRKYLPLPPSLRAAVDHAASGATGGAPRPASRPYPHYDPSPSGAHFSLPLGVGRGAALPLGPSLAALSSSDNGGGAAVPVADVNFAVYSRHAGAVTLCILRRPADERQENDDEEDQEEEQKKNKKATGGGGGAGGYLEIPLDPSSHRTGDVWHVLVRGLRSPADLLYAWRADGPPGTSWMAGGCFHPGFLLLDPYAPSAALALLPPDETLLAAGAPALPPGAGGGGGGGARHALLGSLAPLLPASAGGGGGSREDPGGWAAAARLAERVAPSAAAAVSSSSAAASAAAASRRPRQPLSSTVLVEVDLREFAASCPDPSRRGSYLGALKRLDELAAAGATAVLLRGAMLTDRAVAATAGELFAGEEGDESEEGRRRRRELPPPARRPLSYFAPEVTLCCADEPAEEEEGREATTPSSSSSSSRRQDAAAPRQLKALVAGAHARGLEVLLEADLCLTADAAGGGAPGAGARLQSLAGLDGALYLRGGGGYRGGGVLNAGQPAVRALALAALRRWAGAYRADGFVLANAENLAQDALGAVQDSPPLAEELAADGALGAYRGAGAGAGAGAGGGAGGVGGGGGDDNGGVKVVVSVSDRALLPRGGGRGFPHYGRLAEWNSRFGEDVLALLRDNGAAGLAWAGAAAGGGGGGGSVLSAFATRLAGSPDLFAPAPPGEDWPGGLAAGRAPGWGLNALQPPGSPRAPRDVFSSSPAAGGAPCPEEEALVVARSFLLAQAVAAGAPALDWRALEAPEAGGLGLARFAGVVLALRRRHAALLAPAAFDAPSSSSSGAADAQQRRRRSVRWHARDGPSGAEPDWSGELAARGGVAGANFIAFSVVSSGAGAGAETGAAPSSAVYVAFNPDPLADLPIVPPMPPRGARWRRLVDTSRAAPHDAVLDGGETLPPGGEYVLARRAALMLDAVFEGEEPPAPAAASASSAASSSSSPSAAAGALPPKELPQDADARRAARYLS